MSVPGLVVAVGASAGGVEALTDFVAALPEGFPAPVLVVLHIAPAGTSVLAGILDRRTALDVVTAEHGAALEPGTVYVAPPDRHLVVTDGTVCLNREPRENGHRPAVDPLLRAVATAYGPRAVGVILSGTRDDGSRGLAAVKAGGGHAFVQDPDECLFSDMPDNARRATAVDGVLSVAGIAERLVTLAADPTVTAVADPDPSPDPIHPLHATRFTCPDCGGVLSETLEHGAEAYTCSVGHRYSPQSLQEEQARQLESALWAAVRSLEDRAVLLRRMATRALEAGKVASHDGYEREAADSAVRADLIRDVVARPLVVADDG